MERPEAMREARDEIVGELAPERVVPAKLTAAEDVVLVERGDVLAGSLDGVHGPRDIARDMVGHGGHHVQRSGALDHLFDGERAIRKNRVSVTVSRLPTHELLFKLESAPL